MSHATKHDREEFVAVLTQELPKYSIPQILSIARGLMRQASTHSRLATDYCNGENGIDSENWEDRTSPVRKRILDILKDTGIQARFSSDPRGYTVKLILPSARYNTWGGPEEGWGVPNS